MTASFLASMPKIIGHRGACGHAPENTTASFEKAAELGCKSIEIDVMVTKDNKNVICHDSNVRRCTDGEGPVLLKTLQEIKTLDAGSWFSEEFKGAQIPTLEEAINSIRDCGMSLNLEIKPTPGWQVPTTEHVATELQGLDTTDVPILISSFDIEALALAGKLMPEIELGYLSDALPHEWERRLKEVGASSLHLDKDFVTQENVKAVKNAGYKYLVYTVNDADRAKQLLDWGVDGIITDFPDRMKGLD